MATTPCMAVIPTTTAFEFIKNRPRFRDADNQAWINWGQTAHAHDSSDDLAGGDLADIQLANIGRAYSIDKMAFNAYDFGWKLIGTGSAITNDPQLGSRSRMLLTAGTTLNAAAIAYLMGAEIDFGSVSRLNIIIDIQQDTTVLARAGMGAEDVHIANTITKKYGVEACDSAPEGKFLLLFSSDGVSRTTSGSTTAMTALKGVGIIHQPNMNCKMTVDGVDTIPPMVVKGSNIPSSGGYVADATDTMAIFKTGILAKAASAARTMRISGMKYVGRPNSNRWFQSPPVG